MKDLFQKIGLGLGLLFAAAPEAGAFVNPPTLVPDQPSESDSIVVALTSGHCDDLFPVAAEIFREGSSIRVVIPGQQSTLVCIVPLTEDTVTIGRLPAGPYTLQVDYSHYPPGDPEDITVETIGVIDFVVTSAPGGLPATPVPSIGFVGRATLGLVLLGIAWAGLRRRVGRTA